MEWYFKIDWDSLTSRTIRKYRETRTIYICFRQLLGISLLHSWNNRIMTHFDNNNEMALFVISSLFQKPSSHLVCCLLKRLSSSSYKQRFAYSTRRMPKCRYYYGKPFNFISKLLHLLLPRHILWRAGHVIYQPKITTPTMSTYPNVRASCATRIFERTFNNGEIMIKWLGFRLLKWHFGVFINTRERVLCVRVCSLYTYCKWRILRSRSIDK